MNQFIHIVSGIPASLVPQMAFCKRHSISYHKFKYHWKRQQIKKAAPERSGFIGLKLDGPVSMVKPAEPIKETTVARLFFWWPDDLGSSGRVQRPFST